MNDHFLGNIRQLVGGNNNFRKVVYTGKKSQFVLMSLLPGEEIGEEVHEGNDQFFVFFGMGEAVISGEKKTLNFHDVLFVPAGTLHNIINTGKEDLKLFTLYAPANHPDGVVFKTKEEAEKAHENYTK